MKKLHEIYFSLLKIILTIPEEERGRMIDSAISDLMDDVQGERNDEAIQMLRCLAADLYIDNWDDSEPSDAANAGYEKLTCEIEEIYGTDFDTRRLPEAQRLIDSTMENDQ